jgi:hypothetical protein
MNIIKLIYFFGIVITIFNIIWFFIGWLIKLLFADGRNFSTVNQWVQLLGISLLSSVMALQTLEFTQQNNLSAIGITLLNAVGAFIIYAYVIEKTYQSTFKVSMFAQGANIKLSNRLPKWSVLVALAIYVLSIVWAELAYNPLNKWFYSNIYDIYDTFLLKLIFGVIAVFFVINMLSKAFAATLSLFKIQPKTKETSRQEFDDFEIVEEDEEDDSDDNQHKKLDV